VSDARKLDDVVPCLVPSGPTRFLIPGKGIHGFRQEAFYPAMNVWPVLEQYAENRYDPAMSEHTCVMICQAAAAHAFMHGLGARRGWERRCLSPALRAEKSASHGGWRS